MTLALLMFNYNENEGIKKNIELLKEVVDEILIIDSSNIANYEELKKKYDKLSKFKIIKVFPIGYVEPLRMFALKNINSEFVLYLDADEEPNNKLINFLSNDIYSGIDGYYILRYEEALKCYDYQMRLYKKDKAIYRGIIHEFPKINGVIQKLDHEKIIIHHANYNNYLNVRPSYLLIEAYVRPFSIFFLLRQSKFFKIYRDDEKILSGILVYLIALYLFLRRTLSFDSLKLNGYRLNKFFLRYTIESYRYFKKIKNKEELIKINKCIIQNDGVIKYLMLDDTDYVNHLTETYKYNKTGVEIFEELVKYRYINGKVKEGISTEEIREHK